MFGIFLLVVGMIVLVSLGIRRANQADQAACCAEKPKAPVPTPPATVSTPKKVVAVKKVVRKVARKTK